MSGTGPTPRSRALRMLDGTERDHKPRLVDSTDASLPEPPEWLSDRERDVFQNTVRLLVGLNEALLHAADANAIARYAADLVEYEACRSQIQREGAVVESKSGHPYQHPALGARNKSADRLSAFEKLFGMTPDARERIQFPTQRAPRVRTRADLAVEELIS